MDVYHGSQAKGHKKLKNLIGFHDHDDKILVIVKLSNSWLLKLIYRAIILALFVLSLPWLKMVIQALINGGSNNGVADLDSMNVQILPPLLLHDLANEGLLKLGDRALIVSNGSVEEAIYNFESIREYNIDVIHISEFEQQSSLIIPDESFDIVFAYNNYHEALSLINSSLKLGGVVVVQLNDDNLPSGVETPRDFQIVYLRKFGPTTIVMAMKKITHHGGDDTDIDSSASGRKLLRVAFGGNEAEKATPPVDGLYLQGREFKTHWKEFVHRDIFEPRERINQIEKKKAALENLEDVFLEPPRTTSGKLSRFLKHTRYFPDLMRDSLESYPRRVFIDVGLHENNDDDDDNYSWFLKYYPTRDKEFEIYKVNTVTIDHQSTEKGVPNFGMSNWLENNVKEDEYVVVKAEAEVVEEMVMSKTINLVDELFLECKHQGIKKGGNRRRRAYWECLALYGILRDEGIVVHQWWG